MLRKYEEVHGELCRRLSAGEHGIGERLPPEQELAQEFSVNVHTLRRALAMLAGDGFITRTPGRGTVVVSIPGSDTSPGQVKVVCRVITDTPDCDRCRTASVIGRRFSEMHPHIHVEAVPLLRTPVLLAPSVPEILGSPHPTVLRWGYYADYAKRNAMLALDQFADLPDVAGDVDGRLFYRTRNGEGDWHVHNLPVQLSTWMMMANRSLIDQLGLSLPDGKMAWAEFTNLCEEITRRGKSKGVRAIQLGLLHGSQTITRFVPYFHAANGGRMLVDPATGEPQLDSPGNADALDFIANLYQGNLCHTQPGTDAFLASKAAFVMSVLGEGILSVRRKMPDSDIVALPHPVPRPGAESFGVIRGDFVGILANTVHNRRERLAAWELVKFLISAEGQTLQYQESHLLPVRADLVSRVTEENSLTRGIADYGLRYGTPTFDVPAIDDIHNVIRGAMVRAIRGECSSAQALAEGQDLLRIYVFSNDKETTAPEYAPSLAL